MQPAKVLNNKQHGYTYYQPTHELRNVLDKSSNTKLRRVTGVTSLEKPDSIGMGPYMSALAPRVYSGTNK